MPETGGKGREANSRRFELVSLDRGFHSSSPLTITAAPYIIGIARRTEESRIG